MTLANTVRSYGAVTKSFHWLTALLILTVLPLGWFATDLAHQVRDPASGASDADVARAALLFTLHKTIGVTIFFVALLRILWALTQIKPGLLNAEHKVEAWAAELVHWLLYGSLVAVPLSGWIDHAASTGFAPIYWPFGQSLPFVPKSPAVSAVAGGLHVIFMWLLVGALAAHIAGALKHFVIDRDFTLQRMLPGFREGPQPPAQHHSLLPPTLAVAVWAAAIGVGGATKMLTPPPAAPQAAALEQVASDWRVEDGTLGITVQQMGKPVEGSFADWTAAITFDAPAAPGPAGSVDVTIAIGSLTLGSVTPQAMGADFFNAEGFPTAEFHGQIEKTADGYVARGPLTLKGATVEIELPFSLTLDGSTAVMEGSTSLNRMDFGIGSNMANESSLAFAVEVHVRLTATRGGT
ncbi:cytochrome b/b6 domain-containing protein [Pseudodonghicola flavimaris]|uniref:Cytochrome b/b6 domain-containing protein n=1 Tax=Pseudodonghicola flavimaris TaxID=3050036 RepID=A0ABT7F3S9_9RHOB|nr:cytochrome b/b6 domain-containing protein [Pseudodonghicola flavimaris]MDK3019269.1 cytochrome b/b6 domain-containing protein [Pseudodonghicola flavimaris]